MYPNQGENARKTARFVLRTPPPSTKDDALPYKYGWSSSLVYVVANMSF